MQQLLSNLNIFAVEWGKRRFAKAQKYLLQQLRGKRRSSQTPSDLFDYPQKLIVEITTRLTDVGVILVHNLQHQPDNKPTFPPTPTAKHIEPMLV